MVIATINLIYGADNRGSISGQVVDSHTKEPLGFVNVGIRKQNSTEFLPIGSSTDDNGKFTLSNVPYDTYTLVITFMGYTPHEQVVSLSSAAGNIDLRTILLSEDGLVLDEVQVMGVKSQMRMEIDKKVFNVDQNIAATGVSASDILSNIPSIEVDNEGEISLRGNSSVTIWINGKASGLSADNQAQILEQLPAESIEKIEVITNPSSKYSPEGTAGIINIMLKRDRKAGYYGSVQAGGNSQGGYNASGNINYSSGKLEAYANLGYRHWQNKGGGYSDRLNFSENDTTYLDQTTRRKGDGNNFFGRAGLTYHLTEKDHFSIGGFGMLRNGDNRTTVNYLSNMLGSYRQSQRLTSSDNDMTGGNIELGYKRDFTETSDLDITVSYNKWGSDDTSIYQQNSLYEDESRSNSYQKQLKDINNHNLEFQLDYTNNFLEKHKIEAGYKGTLGREDSPVETYSGTAENTLAAEESLFNRFIYDRDIHAFYTNYGAKYGKLSFQAGLRGEYSNISTRSLKYGETKKNGEAYKTEYFSLFPSFFVTYSLPNENEVQVNYTRRISRPWGGQLNSFANITDSTNISFGNPYLNPQYSNAFELNWLKSWEDHMLSFSGYYRTTDDVIQRISYRDGDIMKSTFQNIAKTTSAGTEIVLKNKFFRRLDLTSTLNLYYYKLDGFTYQPEGLETVVTGNSQKDFSWDLRMIGIVNLPHSYSMQLTGNYNSRRVTAQGYRKGNYALDAGLRKSFNNISLNLSGRDLLDSRKWRTVISGDGFSQESENWRGGRQVSLTVTYSFGNMNPKRGKNRNEGGQESGGYDIGGDY
ncbi:MAG: TonB-dependent receptor [Bacteroides sp.]|nr:TonB-dependent receptor [Bacteroides sp.]